MRCSRIVMSLSLVEKNSPHDHVLPRASGRYVHMRPSLINFLLIITKKLQNCITRFISLFHFLICTSIVMRIIKHSVNFPIIFT